MILYGLLTLAVLYGYWQGGLEGASACGASFSVIAFGYFLVTYILDDMEKRR